MPPIDLDDDALICTYCHKQITGKCIEEMGPDGVIGYLHFECDGEVWKELRAARERLARYALAQRACEARRNVSPLMHEWGEMESYHPKRTEKWDELCAAMKADHDAYAAWLAANAGEKGEGDAQPG